MGINSLLHKKLLGGLILAAIAGSALAQDAPKKETIGGWQSTFRTFRQQSVDRKIQIQKSLPGFASRFVQLLLKTPEFRADRAFADRLRIEVDEVMEDLVEGRISKEDARKTIDNLCDEVRALNGGATKGLGQTTAQMLVQSIRLGMGDCDESVRNATQAALLDLTRQKYRPNRSTIRRGCGMASDESTFRDLLVIQISDLVREQARRRPQLFLEALQSKEDGFESMFLALAETKSPSVRATMVERASQGDKVGLEALISWPVPEGLDVVINRFRSGIPEDEETYETALLVYGEKGLRKLAPIWSSLPESSRSIVYVAMESLPCKAALDLLERDARDKRPEIRAEAASLIGNMLVREWHEWYEWFAGPDPKNMDSKRGIRLLRALARDPDPNVRDTALGFLDQE